MQPVQKTSLRAAADLAQALASPLNGLLAMGELLQRQALPETARAQLWAMLDAGRRMTGILCDCIDTSDIFTVPEPTSLRDLIDDVEARWHAQAREAATPFLISSNASPDLRLMVDPARLRRLLNTLIEDAFQARAWGVVEVQLTVQPMPGGLVSIAGRIDAPGAGLSTGDATALELCRAIVEQMGGELLQGPGPGSGVRTTFRVQAEDAGRDYSNATEMQAEGPLPPRTHLLIVDDNATNRIVAAALCEMFGCTSEAAEDGLEAVDAVKSRHFDLILMDIKMPRMDGIEATRAIRALPAPASSIPIVALTANADAEASAAYIAAGMQAVVDKPIKPEQLLNTLQWALSSPDAAPVLQISAA